jgi:hypothetical protein
METAAISLLLEKAGPKALILMPEAAYGENPGRNRGVFCLKSLIGTRTTLNPGRRQGQGRMPKSPVQPAVRAQIGADQAAG